MEKIDVADSKIVIACSSDELIIINNALNEVINGIDVPEFETRMGVSKKRAASLLNEINNFI